MFKRYLLLIVFVLIIPACRPFITEPGLRKPGFYMGNFYVSIDESSVKMNNVPIPKERWRDPKSPFEKHRGLFSGKGSILIHNEEVPVTFEDVRVKKYPTSYLEESYFMAVSGIVKGKSPSLFGPFGGNQINYVLNNCDVRIKISSINITVESATADVDVRLHNPTFCTVPANLILKSASCNIEPTGSIEGGNFHGNTVFDLKDSVYSLRLKQSDDQFVRLVSLSRSLRESDILLPKTLRPLIEIKGTVSRDDIDLFLFSGRINPELKSADFTLNLLDPPIVSSPEPNYVLTLYSGEVEYQYDKDGLQSCEGFFNADVNLPETIINESNDVITLENITLKTDKTGTLFNYVTVGQKIKAGYLESTPGENNIFLILPKEEGCWLFFSCWHKNFSSYNLKGGELCKDHYRILDTAEGTTLPDEYIQNVYTRPGLTILEGIVQFKAPQVTFGPGEPVSDYYQLQTPFWSVLTCTPWGITGELTSSGYSFVPYPGDINESNEPVNSKQYTWDEIIELGNTPPEEPEERFTLAGFRILDMHVDSLRICKNELDDSSFRYTIHFPFPSFIDLEFEDNTLDDNGEFRRAFGPIAPFSSELIEQPSSSWSVGRIQPWMKKYIPVSKILFAWRLPVAFYNRGVVIEYKNGKLDPIANVFLPVSSDDEKIICSELKIVPLYSLNSDLKFGIRFRGMLSTEGEFELLDWDREPFFSKIYPTPGEEKNMGFATRAIDISLNIEEYPDPNNRIYDFKWEGDIQFPFFDWQDSDFTIKDLVPNKQLPVSLSKTGSGCNVELELTIDELKYIHEELVPFTSIVVEANEVDNNGNRIELEANSLNISSYLNGFVLLENGSFEDINIPVPDTTIILKDAVRSDSIIDLVCYDPNALGTRQDYNIPGSCCEMFWIGTCEVTTSEGKLIMSAPNTKYYLSNPDKLELNASNMTLTDDYNDTVIGIPGAELTIKDDGTIEGAFGATCTHIATSLPYEGEFRFFLDPDEGHFYVQIAGSFTFYFRFSGQVFIVHAPYSRLTDPPDFLTVPNIIEDVRARALFESVYHFKKTVGFISDDDDDDYYYDELHPNSIITGFITSGTAQYGIDVTDYGLTLQASSGPGIYWYRFKNPSTSGHHLGTFVNTRASADILTVHVIGYNSLSGDYSSGDDEVTMTGYFLLEGCVDVTLGYCEARVEGTINFSSESGFDFSESGLSSDCGTGGCD